MKLIAMALLTLLVGKGCGEEQDKDLKDAVLEYTANTRGFYYKLTVQDQQLLVSRDRNGNDKPEARKLPAEDWKALVDAFEDIKIEQLPDLKAPTEKRFYDGAAIANLKVTYQGKEYVTTDFDDGFPPAEIADLVNKITKYKPTRE